MKQKIVYLMSGIPAAGKSTWIRNHMTPHSEWISRDNVRFSIVKENEDYFSHEDEVFDTFIAYINQTLNNPDVEIIFIDATHLNAKSRRKTISKIQKQNIAELNCVCFTTSLETCLARNACREGRARVPETAIRNMSNSFTIPDQKENFNHVFVVEENEDIMEVLYEQNFHNK